MDGKVSGIHKPIRKFTHYQKIFFVYLVGWFLAYKYTMGLCNESCSSVRLYGRSYVLHGKTLT